MSDFIHDLAARERPFHDATFDSAQPVQRPKIAWRRVSDVESEELEWLWFGLIPLGKLTLLAGDPGLGKSFVTTDMAARITQGAEWPDQPGPQPAGSVIFLACEDDVADTIRPRLDRANADVEKVIVVDAVVAGEHRRGFTLDGDLKLLRGLIDELGDVRAIVIDPISAYCGSVDSHKNADVRALLAPLTDLAAECRLAVVAINHLTKGTGKAVYRSMGSIAFAAAARAAWNFYKDPDDEKRRLMLPTKMNLAADTYGLAYRIEDGLVCWERDPVRETADDVQAREGSHDQESSDPWPITWLRDRLSNGSEKASTVEAEARAEGITKKQLRTARERLGVNPRKSDFEGSWFWELPDLESVK